MKFGRLVDGYSMVLSSRSGDKPGRATLVRFSAPQLQCAKKFHDQPIFNTNAIMPSTHKKEKPWDTDDIDKWKV